MHMSRITGKYWGVLLIAVAVWQVMGCENESAMTGNTVDEHGPVQSPPAGEGTVWGGSTTAESEFWSPFSKSSRMIALDEECCETTGHANECWEEDALADDVAGNIFCKTDADCGGGICNTSPDVKDALSEYSRIQAAGYEGLCQCSGDEDCQDASGDGGMCFFFGDDGTGTEVSVCGPSMCNGYYVCSCWGGCVWWDGNNAENTPADDAATVGLHCCENRAYSDPRTDSGIVLFGNATCKYECDEDEDCLAPSVHDPDMVDACVAVSCNTVLNTCQYTPLTGTECELDNDICSVDLCTANGACIYDGPRVLPDTFGASSENNTCTEDCVASADNTTWSAYVPLSLPQDIATRPTSNVCMEWTCVTDAGVTYPEEQAVVCADANPADCTEPVCDLTGTQGNCSSTVPVACSEVPSTCNTSVCLDSLGACTEVLDSAQEGETLLCTMFNNPFRSSLRPNCESACQSRTHSGDSSELEGFCSDLYAVNDSCDTAIDLGSFTATGGETLLDAKGSTYCATNVHQADNLTCREARTGARMGYDSPDVVYKFQYEPTDDGIQQEYVIKLESTQNPYFDSAVYVSIGDASCVDGAISSKDCDIYDPPDSSYPDKSHEDRCIASAPHPVSMDLCEPVDTTGTYDQTSLARAIVLEDTSDFSSGPITVYVYVDGNTESTSTSNWGDFYLSVTRTNSHCLPISKWYDGTVRVPAGAPDGLPINGVDFPGFSPNQLTGSFGFSANGVLLSGDSNDDDDYYQGESGDIIWEWRSYDEAWQLDVQTDAQFTTSFCDYESAVADVNYDTMIGLFNCRGERIIFNDNGAGLPYYPEGDTLCLNGKSHIALTPTLSVTDSPYYLIVDGYHNEWTSRGKQTGSSYDLAVYYDPVMTWDGATDCDLSQPGSFGLIRSGSTGPYPDRATISFPDNECALLVDSSASDTIPGRTVQFHWDGGIQPGSWECDHGQWAYCLPVMLIMTLIYDNAAGDVCKETLTNWSDGDHGWFPGITVPYTMTTVDGVTCDEFVGIAATFRYSPNLTSAQRTACETNCATVNLKFDG